MSEAYRVLARKYRPQNFAELIGQEALVRTLTNAIGAGRIAHAFMLTGVRGVGKTTSARIIARALNCVGEDGQGGPTPEPCGVCEHCVSITEDRHVDVMEMDAASRTGVADIRELIDSVRYGPLSARYKIYIIDEVHMLSTAAFNALLKTLEEPPEHTKFIFATTELRKVPVTVLSRCQRFDLRRVPIETLCDHFARIAEAESVSVEPEAIRMMARAADGSVRDGLSLLDRAISLSGQVLSLELVRDMLGLSDRARIYDLLQASLTGGLPEALNILADLHGCGAEPTVTCQDLLEITHEFTRLQAVPGLIDQPETPENLRRHAAGPLGKLAIPALTRVWQILLKGLDEIRLAPSPHRALEMVVIRLACAANLPDPAALIRKFQSENGDNATPARPIGGSGTVSAPVASRPVEATTPTQTEAPVVMDQVLTVPATPATPADPETPRASPCDFGQIVELCSNRREATMAAHLRSHVRLVQFRPGMLEINLTDNAPTDLPGRLARNLDAWCDRKWLVVVVDGPAQPTLLEQEEAHKSADLRTAEADHLVQSVILAFPGAKIIGTHNRASVAGQTEMISPEPEDMAETAPDALIMEEGLA